MLKPPTRKQIADYDVRKRDGDRFYNTNSVHMQCQFVDGDLIVHDIAVDEAKRGQGIGRETMRLLRATYPDERIVANGVEWESEEAGGFWKAMLREGFLDGVSTYSDGEMTLATLEAETASPAP